VKYGHLEGGARTVWNMDTWRVEQEQCGIWTPRGWSKNRVEYGHLEGGARTGWNMDTWRVEHEQCGIWTTTGRSKNKEGISPPTGRRKNEEYRHLQGGATKRTKKR
jgi:hypothetical protein